MRSGRRKSKQLSASRAKSACNSVNLATDAPFDSIFEAIQEQLGLKLTAGKGMIRLLVIDGSRRPTGN
jgi:uncharacterized protein (TIGR03435 family)